MFNIILDQRSIMCFNKTWPCKISSNRKRNGIYFNLRKSLKYSSLSKVIYNFI